MTLRNKMILRIARIRYKINQLELIEIEQRMIGKQQAYDKTNEVVAVTFIR